MNCNWHFALFVVQTAFVIYNFIRLCVAYVGGEAAILSEISGKPVRYDTVYKHHTYSIVEHLKVMDTINYWDTLKGVRYFYTVTDLYWIAYKSALF